MQIDNLPPVRDIISKFGLSAKKSLGQNFITDNNFLLKMDDHIDSSKNNIIIEIGPGKVLTGLIKRMDKNVKTNTINTDSDIKELKL